MFSVELRKIYVKKGFLADVESTLTQLKQNGGNINSRDEFDLPPLHIATWRNHLPIARGLITAGADPNARVSYSSLLLFL